MSNYNGSNEPAAEQNGTVCRAFYGFDIALMIYSTVVLLLYALIQRRTTLYKNYFYGHFGIPIPINLIHETKDRWVYVATFAALTVSLVSLIFGGGMDVVHSKEIAANIWRGVLLFLFTLSIPLKYFGLFASIHGTVQLLSHFIGLSYVIILLVQLVLHCRSCIKEDIDLLRGIERNTEIVNELATCITPAICYIIVGAYFVIKGGQAAFNIIRGKPFHAQQSVAHYIGHVKRIFKRSPEVPSNRFFAFLHRANEGILRGYMYQWDPYFKYSVRILSTVTIVTLATFVFSVQAISGLVGVVDEVKMIRMFAESIEISQVQSFLNQHHDLLDAIVGLLYFFSVLIPVGSFLMVFFSTMIALSAYRRHCKLYWKGESNFLPTKKSPAKLLVSSTFYFGYQIAMGIWAWILFVAVFWLIALIFIGFISALDISKGLRKWLAERAILIASSIVTGLAIYFGQLLFVRFAFTRTDSVLVDNRRMFHLYTYFFLFYYMLVGIIKSIRRVLTAAVVNLFFMSRLDHSVIVLQGLKFLDKGYISYTSLLRVDAIHNNPVMNVFVYLLSQTVEAKKRASITQQELRNPSIIVKSIEKISVTKYYEESPLSVPLVNVVQVTNNAVFSKSRARIRWHLAYTLVRNPELIELRRRVVEVGDKADLADPTGFTNHAYCDDDDSSIIVTVDTPKEKDLTEL